MEVSLGAEPGEGWGRLGSLGGSRGERVQADRKPPGLLGAGQHVSRKRV